MAYIGVAVDQAQRLTDIQFPEFTAKLITDTFDAIVAANQRQTESYIELLEATSKDLSTYINDTKDDVSGAEILDFLTTTVPANDTNPTTRVAVGNTLTSAEATTLGAALTVPGTQTPTVATGPLATADMNSITSWAAIRLAANKYTLLQQMVKMGLMRLVVTDGKIVTQLLFSTWASSFYSSNSTAYNTRDFSLNVAAKSGKALAKWFSASVGAKYTTMSVRTTNEMQQDNSGSSVNIFGRVEINFKTDYQPLNQ